MTFNELQQAYSYWQNQYNQSVGNPQLWQVQNQAVGEMQKIQQMMTQLQSNIGYGAPQGQYGYNNATQNIGVGYNQAQLMTGSYQQPQYNYNYQNQSPSFAVTNVNQAIPSMQLPANDDKYSDGRYRKQAAKNMGLQQPSINTGFTQQEPVKPAEPPKPTKYIQGHRWSYLCNDATQCLKEVQGEYVSYKVKQIGTPGAPIENLTEKDTEPMCLEKAVNKYGYVDDGNSAAFVDLKFSRSFTNFNIHELANCCRVIDSDSVKSTNDKEVVKEISEYLSKKEMTNKDKLRFIKESDYLNQFFDHRYSRIFNSVAKSNFELNTKVDNIITEQKDILEYIRKNNDEKVLSGCTRLVNTLNDLVENKDKITLTFVEGSEKKDTYLKVKWDYIIKGMYVDGLLMEYIDEYISEYTIDKGLSPFYKITSQSFKELYDVLNQCDWGNELTLYMFTRITDGNYVAYEIVKGDIGTFYLANLKIYL